LRVERTFVGVSSNHALQMQFVSKTLEEYWFLTPDTLHDLVKSSCCAYSTCENIPVRVRA